MIVDVERLLPVTEPVPTLVDYLAIGGGQGLGAARERGPEWVLETVERARLRERAEVGLPAVCTWDREGIVVSPESARDRFIIGRNPYQLIEGLMIAALAVGASRTVIAIDRRFEAEIARLCEALDELAAASMLGPASVRLALEPEPFACDVEAIAHVPEILRRGPEWFRANETMVYSVSGEVTAPGVFELPVGISVRMLVNVAAGGVEPGHQVVCEETGAELTEDQLDVPITVGSGGFLVTETETSTLVPSPGRERIVSDAPISSARSAMLFSP